MAWVYMLRCEDGSIYTGIARDVTRRLAQHQAGRGAKYTAARLPVALVWSKQMPSWPDAMREEIRIKRLPRAKKLALIDAG
jgi:predicted GIY-YIG superfamily endonuclease